MERPRYSIRFGAGKVENGRGQVDVADQAVVLDSLREPGPPNEQRNTDRLLVGVCLPRSQAVLPSQKPVVRGGDKTTVSSSSPVRRVP